MKYADELRGSEGERCTVVDLRNGTKHDGQIERVYSLGDKVDVRYDDGTLVRVGYSFVTLHGEETP